MRRLPRATRELLKLIACFRDITVVIVCHVYQVDVSDERLAELEEDSLARRALSVLLQLLAQSVHGGADLQRGAQLDLELRTVLLIIEWTHL